jgi:hypothetical protein
MEERRSQPRYRPVILRAALATDSGSIVVEVRDISVDGICFWHTTPLSVGEHCRMSLTLDLGPGRSSEPLELPFRVVWSTPVDRRVQIGAVFLPLSSGHRKALQGMIFLLTREVAEDEEGRLAFRTGLFPSVDPDDKH